MFFLNHMLRISGSMNFIYQGLYYFYFCLERKSVFHSVVYDHTSIKSKRNEWLCKASKKPFGFSTTIEFIGALILSARWIPEYGARTGIYVAFFYAVSPYNNAGFSIWLKRSSSYVGDMIINHGIVMLFISRWGLINGLRNTQTV